MTAYKTESNLVCEKVIGVLTGVSRTTLYRHRKYGMPHHKFGRRVLYRFEEVVEWTRSNASMLSAC